MSGYPVYRIQKLKNSGNHTPGATMGHLRRSRVTPNADASATPNNRWLIGNEAMDLKAEIQRRLAAAGIRPRANATIGVDFLLTASPEFFSADKDAAYGVHDPVRLEAFVAAAETFMLQEFGERVVCAVLHLDEATPHVQGVMIPILPPLDTGRMRLSAKLGFDRSALRRQQTAWQALLAPHGCKERLVGSTSHHLTNKKYHATVDQIAKKVDGLDWTMEPFPLFSSDPEERLLAERGYHERQVVRIKTAIMPLAQAAVYGQMFAAERRRRQRLEKLLAIAKNDLVLADRKLEQTHDEIGRRLDLSVPREALSERLGMSFSDGPVLDQVCRRDGLSLGRACEYMAVSFGTDAALAMLVESMRPRFEKAIALRSAEDDSVEEDGNNPMSP